jgi:hypothetical protein
MEKTTLRSDRTINFTIANKSYIQIRDGSDSDILFTNLSAGVPVNLSFVIMDGSYVPVRANITIIESGFRSVFETDLSGHASAYILPSTSFSPLRFIINSSSLNTEVQAFVAGYSPESGNMQPFLQVLIQRISFLRTFFETYLILSGV